MRIKMAFALAMVLTGCVQQADVADVLGVYVTHGKEESEKLTIRKDQTYMYEFQNGRGVTLKNSGEWKLESHEGHPGITFSEFVFGRAGYGGQKSGYWNVAIERSLIGGVQLCIDPDRGYCLVKQ